MKSDEGLFWKSNWQLTFWNLRFGLVRFLNEQGEYFGKKICLLTCAVAKFFQLLNLWTKSHRGAIHKKTSQAELPCETIWVTVVYNREWNISWILAWVILRRWKGNERPRKNWIELNWFPSHFVQVHCTWWSLNWLASVYAQTKFVGEYSLHEVC